jgi:hypothetical protein
MISPRKQMATHLFTWKKQHYPELYDDYQKWLDGSLKTINWSAGKFKDIPKEARVFLMRQGTQPGIIAAGRTTSENMPRPHRDATPGKLENSNDIEIEEFSHPDNPLVSLDELLAIENKRAGLWLYGSPGIAIPPDAAEKLERAWSAAAREAGISRTRASAGIPELKRIKTVDDLAENFATFQREARHNQRRSAAILTATIYWVRDDNSEAFGPGKFLGFKGMNFPLYEQAKSGRTKGYEFQGKITREAIEKVLGQKFHADHDLIEECRRWGEEYFGRAAFGKANGSKWKFIRYAVPGREVNSLYPDELTQPERLTEGALRTVTVNAYERNPKARQKCIDHYKPICQVCNLNFVERYGEMGRGFIHVHHLKQLSEIGEEYEVDPIEDLRPVCPNCHAMLHTSGKPTIEELRKIVKKIGI